MKQKQTPKQRNPVAAYAKRSGAGVHGKSKKAERRDNKQFMKAFAKVRGTVDPNFNLEF